MTSKVPSTISKDSLPYDAELSIGSSASNQQGIMLESARVEGSAVYSMKITRRDHAVTFITFIVMGTAAMIFWNTLIGSLFSVQSLVFPEKGDMSDTITAVYTTMALIVTAALIRFQIIDVRFLVVGAIGFIIATLGVAMSSNLSNATAAQVLLHIFAILGGACTAFFESSMFGFASVLPYNYVGPACLGLGISGIVSFAVWMFLSKVVFEMSRSGVQRAVWVYLSFAAVVQLLAAVLFGRTYKQSWAKNAIDVARNQRMEKANQQTEQTKPYDVVSGEASLSNQGGEERARRTRWHIFKDASEQILNVSATLFITMMMFPNIAPYSFGRSVMETDILMGVWQCGEFFGRYLPNLRYYFSFVVVRPSRVKYFTIGRILFIPLFMVVYKYQENELPVLSAFWFQIILLFAFVFSNGWICTLSSMYVPDCVEDADEKGQAATMYLLCLLSGLTAGIWTTKLWRLV